MILILQKSFLSYKVLKVNKYVKTVAVSTTVFGDCAT